MTPAGTPADAFAHVALLYSGSDEFLAATMEFVRAGLAAGEPVAVAVPTGNLMLLKAALGRDAEEVRLVDMSEAGRNPGRIIPAVLHAFADAHPADRVRIVGESTWPGRTSAEYPACAQHEALINAAFAGRPITMLCPYDLDGLDQAAVADAHATHPFLDDGAGRRASEVFAPGRVLDHVNVPLPWPPTAFTLSFDRDSFPKVRHIAVERAHRAGLPGHRMNDMAVAVSELAANVILHGDGAGIMRIWSEGVYLVCEIQDGGRLADPLAGRRPVPPDSLSGRGLLLVNLVADLVRTHAGALGTRVRFHLSLNGNHADRP